MKKIFLIAFISAAIFSCKKDDDGSINCFEPLSVTAGQIGPTSALVEWDPGNETAFEVEYGLSGFATGTGIVAQTSQINFFIDGLTESTNYDAYVRSNCGSDGFSNYVKTSFTTLEPLNICNIPTGLFLINVTSTTIEFGWEANDETAFVIEYGPSGFPVGTGTEIPTSQTFIEITGLTPSTTYEIYVRANCSLSGLSDYSDQLVVTTDP